MQEGDVIMEGTTQSLMVRDTGNATMSANIPEYNLFEGQFYTIWVRTNQAPHLTQESGGMSAQKLFDYLPWSVKSNVFIEQCKRLFAVYKCSLETVHFFLVSVSGLPR